MMPPLPTRHDVGDGVTYLHHPDHRNGNHHKSQWSITQPEELQSFVRSGDEGWLGDLIGWGLHVVNGRAAYLGVGRDRTVQLFIAKFVDPGGAHEWHGYPTDHRSGGTDVPAANVADLWMSDGLLRPA